MERIIDGATYVTAEQAAELLHVTPTRVLMLLRDDSLKGVQADGEWLVSVDSISCFRSHGNDMKEARGCVSYCSAKGCGCK